MRKLMRAARPSRPRKSRSGFEPALGGPPLTTCNPSRSNAAFAASYVAFWIGLEGPRSGLPRAAPGTRANADAARRSGERMPAGSRGSAAKQRRRLPGGKMDLGIRFAAGCCCEMQWRVPRPQRVPSNLLGRPRARESSRRAFPAARRRAGAGGRRHKDGAVDDEEVRVARGQPESSRSTGAGIGSSTMRTGRPRACAGAQALEVLPQRAVVRSRRLGSTAVTMPSAEEPAEVVDVAVRVVAGSRRPAKDRAHAEEVAQVALDPGPREPRIAVRLRRHASVVRRRPRPLTSIEPPSSTMLVLEPAQAERAADPPRDRLSSRRAGTFRPRR
jgi:hypothetical protein